MGSEGRNAQIIGHVVGTTGEDLARGRGDAQVHFVLAADEAAAQGVGAHVGDLHVGRSLPMSSAALEVDHPVVLGAATELHGIHLGGLHQDALHRAQHGAADEHGLVIDAVLQSGQAGFLHLHVDVIGQVRGRGAGRGL